MKNSTEDRPIKAPKVFVSYAQSEERTAWVKDICERLLHDGVDVVADLYELPHGADIHAFMERCVNDPTITRVLMLCDRLYCDKANGRLGGLAVFLYELFLRTVGTLLSLNAHETLAALLQRLYVVPTHERSSWGNMARFTIFWTYSKILENKKHVRRLDRYDLLADIMKERCGTSASVFQSLMEADLLLALRSILHKYSGLWWYPRTLIYSSQRVLPLFARAEQHQQFGVLCKLIGVTDKQELQGLFLPAVEKNPSVKTLYLNSLSPASFAALINFDRLDTLA